MIRLVNFRAIGAALILLAAPAAPASAQFNVQWSAATGAFSTGANWVGGSPPVSNFDDVGVINNGGTAQVADTPISPSAVVLGQTAGNSGTLEIRSGGNLSVVNGGQGASFGAVTVGQAGTGTLNVLRGGTLTANGLSSGGATGSSIVLGQTTGSGTANVTINGTSNLQRNLRVVGPNVAFTTAELSFGGSHTLTEEITGATHSALKASGTASLGGTLNVAFTGVTPAIGNSWALVDAHAITGNFSNITSSASLAPGLGFGVTTVNGGVNGKLAQLSVVVQLKLEIDRRTGAATIRNLASQSLNVDGYLITSAGAALKPATWSSFQDSAQAGWTESNPTSKHLGELNISGQRSIGAGQSINLGSAYGFTPTALGQKLEDVAFEYHAAGGQTFSGKVEYTGLQNNVVLLVDPATGKAAIQNQSIFNLNVDGYLITSTAGALNPAAWTSFQDSGQTGWTESNPTAKHLGELNLGSSRFLGQSGAPLAIGSPFTVGGAQNLTFEYRLSTGETMDGIVQYGAFSTGGNANFDADSDVDGNDFLLWQRRLGAAGGQGDANGDGVVNGLDLAVWKQQFGASATQAAGAVPEPSSLGLAGAALALVAAASHRRGR